MAKTYFKSNYVKPSEEEKEEETASVSISVETKVTPPAPEEPKIAPEPSDKWICDICGREFKSFKALAAHKRWCKKKKLKK